MPAPISVSAQNTDPVNLSVTHTFHDEFLWVLSDENRILYKISPIDYKIIDNWKVDVPTPEGLAFFADHLYIVSDNYNMIFDMGIIK